MQREEKARSSQFSFHRTWRTNKRNFRSVASSAANLQRSNLPLQRGAVRLMDVADVMENHQPMIGDALATDGANLLLVIEKFPGSDTVQVTRGVEAALAALRPGLGGMENDSSIFRPATFIELAKKNLTRAVLIASVIVVLMPGLFFFNWRATLISLITIPLALIAAGLVLQLRGATLNTLVLTGLVIAIGVIVDDTARRSASAHSGFNVISDFDRRSIERFARCFGSAGFTL